MSHSTLTPQFDANYLKIGVPFTSTVDHESKDETKVERRRANVAQDLRDGRAGLRMARPLLDKTREVKE